MTVSKAGSAIESEFRQRFAGSNALHQRALQAMPSGITHDIRRLEPFPVYMAHAQGCRKWDVDGHEFVDYMIGHAALILGHGHPAVVQAVQEQVTKATHLGACHELEVRWAELVQRLIPSAERVRFVMSGTEGTMLAMRLARAHTGRSVVARLQGHFHGWHDYALLGFLPPYDVPSSAGIPAAISGTMRIVPMNDLAAVEAALAPRDVAALILEPEGPRAGTIPNTPEYLRGLRELTQRYGTLLIFDEVISGFRMTSGGAQQFFGVVPDLTVLAKAVSGGLPGGALVGRAEVMSEMAFRSDDSWNRFQRVLHYGTWNANPLCAAAGVAALSLLADGSVQDHAAAMAERLRAGLNRVLAEAGVAGCATGLRSSLHVILGEPGDLPETHDPSEFLRLALPKRLLEGTRQPLSSAFYRALLLEGLDLAVGTHGWLSFAHKAEDVDASIERFARALHRVVAEGLLTARKTSGGTVEQR